MTAAALKGLLGRKLRTVLTALAIVLGVAMVSGAYVITDTMLKASNSLKTASYSGADAVVTGRTAFSVEGSGGKTVKAVPESLVQKVRTVPQVAVAQGEITDTAKITKKNGKILNTQGGPPFAVGFDANTPAAQRLSPFKVRSGHFPASPNEVALDVSIARKEHYMVGDSVGIVALGPAQ